MDMLLLEIGAEEIPAGYIEPALSAMSAMLAEKMTQSRIDFGEISTFGSPRRLTVMVKDVAAKQRSLTTEVVGPPETVGFDSEGKPTVAAQKFAEKVGISMDRIRVKNTEKGRYLSALKTERGLSTRTLLKGILPEVILATPFPKRMRWESLQIEFARPIHSILALLGGKIVTFTIEQLKSGRFTRGHSFMAPGRIKIDHPDEYVEKLRKAHVIVGIDERRIRVAETVSKAASQAGGTVLEDEELLQTVTHLVETPVPVVGRFEEKFLELPSEILITAMREHQKYFAVVDDAGKLMPCFIAVNNTVTKDLDLVAKGHEKVIRARLEDARFFYRGDVSDSLDSWVEKLKGVLFQAKLGTIYEKIMRVQKIAETLVEAQGLGQDFNRLVARAAYLCKADLVSQVVVEFPKLQGVMGRIYAEVKGEDVQVAEAIEEHYRPVRSGGTLPQGTAGAVLSIADKIDSICGCFSVGLIPTGAADPYALRRQGIGIIQIMLEKRFTFSLQRMLEKSVQLFSGLTDQPVDETVTTVYDFLKNRISHLLAEEGYAKDVIAAVVSVGVDNIPDVWNRTRELNKLKQEADFEPLAAAFKRVGNIIRQADATPVEPVDPALFKHGSENALFTAFQEVSGSVQANLEKGAFDIALKEIATLRPAVDAFFDGVMVMAEDIRVRANRLSLLYAIAGLFNRIADFSKLSA